jgi:hypothetical protein
VTLALVYINAYLFKVNVNRHGVEMEYVMEVRHVVLVQVIVELVNVLH